MNPLSYLTLNLSYLDQPTTVGPTTTTSATTTMKMTFVPSTTTSKKIMTTGRTSTKGKKHLTSYPTVN